MAPGANFIHQKILLTPAKPLTAREYHKKFKNHSFEISSAFFVPLISVAEQFILGLLT
jgi:hypothetical protein